MSKHVKYYFTNNKKIGSKYISWLSKKGGQEYINTPSHFAVCFFDMFIIESRFKYGVKIDFINAFRKRNNIIGVYADKKSLSPRETKWLLNKLLESIYGSRYDWASALYFNYRLLLHKWFNLDVPKINKAEDKNRNFCTEVYEIISKKEMSMVTPNMLMRQFDVDAEIERLEDGR